jgi:hypothetical protein
MNFENKSDLEREQKAIELFTSFYGLNYQKLEAYDIDFIVSKELKNIAFVEVKGRKKTIKDSFPLPLSTFKINKLYEKKFMGKQLKRIMIWACDDGIIYADLSKLEGLIREGGRPNRDGSYRDTEMMAYYQKQENMKYLFY